MTSTLSRCSFVNWRSPFRLGRRALVSRWPRRERMGRQVKARMTALALMAPALFIGATFVLSTLSAGDGDAGSFWLHGLRCFAWTSLYSAGPMLLAAWAFRRAFVVAPVSRNGGRRDGLRRHGAPGAHEPRLLGGQRSARPRRPRGDHVRRGPRHGRPRPPRRCRVSDPDARYRPISNLRDLLARTSWCPPSMLRSNLLGSRVALGFSATLHAALLFASTGNKATLRSVIAGTAEHRRRTAPAPPPEPATSSRFYASPRRRESARASTPQHGSLAPPRDVSRPGGGKSTPGAASRADRPAGVGREVPRDPATTSHVSRASARPATGNPWYARPASLRPTTAARRFPSKPSMGAPVSCAARPAYPDSARADGVEGDVRLELVVDVSGVVESAGVVRGVGHGLDESALRVAGIPVRTGDQGRPPGKRSDGVVGAVASAVVDAWHPDDAARTFANSPPRVPIVVSAASWALAATPPPTDGAADQGP